MNPIVGLSGLGTVKNNPWTGGYGGAASGAAVTANQIGVNTVNGVGAAFADGTNIALSQLPGASPVAGGGPILQGGSLNMSTTNTLLAYATAGTVSINGNNGVNAGVPVRGNQTAVNTFNASTLVGNNLSVGAQQLADGLNPTQTGLASVNRALAYSPGNVAANIDPSVTNLNQSASVGINALNLQSGNGATTVSLSGLQSVGYNTVGLGGVLTGGTAPVAVTTNQIAASTVGAGGFLPTGASWTGFAGTVASGMPIPGSASYPSSVNQQNASAFLGGSFTPNVAGATNPYTTLNAGTVQIASVGQSVNLTNNTVSAGSSASPANVAFGPAGFEQRTGTIGIASNTAGGASNLISGIATNVTSPGGLSNAQALTGVGSASINALAQSFQSANNTFQGSGDVGGTLTQLASGVTFNAAEISGTGSSVVNGGSGLSTGSTNAVYGLATPVVGSAGSALNNAVAGSVYGPVSLTTVGQTGTTFVNVAAASGTIDTAASGTLAQSLGPILGYDGVQNSAVAVSVASGNVVATGTTQSLNLTGNAVQANAVNGSVAQLSAGATAPQLDVSNVVLASAGNGIAAGQGSAALSNTTQSNTVTLNAIQSAGALGSSTVPAAFSQQSGTAASSLYNQAFSTTTPTFNNAFITPSNLAVAQSTNGAGGSATANSTVQVAGLAVNNLTGGTSAGLGITGIATQVSYGQATSIGNQALAYAASAPLGALVPNPGANVANNAALGGTMLGAQGVMSGNAALTNQQQLATQSLNTMSLAGANNGNLNQATFGATNQTTGNQLYAQSNSGYALTTGAQTATNAVNVITSP